MKRILSLLIVLATLLQTTAFASELDFLIEPMLEYEGTMELSLKLNKPIPFFEKALDESEVFDGDVFLNSLFATTATYDVKAVISSDYNKMDLSMLSRFNFPVEINKNLAVTSDVGLNVWAKYDITNTSTPVYKVIFEHPFSNKYYEFDLFELVKLGDADNYEHMINTLTSVYSTNYTDSAASLHKELLTKYAKIEKTATSCRIVLDDNGAKNYMLDLIEFSLEKSQENATKNGFDEEILPENFREEAEAFINNITLFADDAIVMEYTLDGNKITASTVTVNVDTNIYDIMALTGDYDEEITKENSDLCFTITAAQKFNKTSGVNIEYPTLTAENSISVLDEITAEPAEYEYVSHYMYLYEDTYIPAGDNSCYFKIRNVVDKLDDETMTLDYNSGFLTITTASGKERFTVLDFSVGDSVIYMDGAAYALENPPIMHNGSVYVDASFISQAFAYEMTSANYRIQSGNVSANFFKE